MGLFSFATKRLQLLLVALVIAAWSATTSTLAFAIHRGTTSAVEEEEEGTLHATKKSGSSPSSCTSSEYDFSLLTNPCQLDASLDGAPEEFSLVFPTTSYGTFTARCVRARAPIWADRVYKLAKHGYYDGNYFFRVIPGRYTQFGTHGNPKISNVYNYTSTSSPECSILAPQPPFMPYCMAKKQNPGESGGDGDGDGGGDDNDECQHADGLSNDFGTLAMSTSYNKGMEEFPNGVTWNATAELFLNIGHNNQFLDDNLFVPICSVSREDMEAVVLHFPSLGEVAELGGDGPSLGRLYEEGNAYIESNPDWSAMAKTGIVEVCP